MTSGPGDHWVPRFLPGVGVCFDLMETYKRLSYANCPWDVYGMLIRFSL
jgi:hypothetical protein